MVLQLPDSIPLGFLVYSSSFRWWLGFSVYSLFRLL